MRKLTLALTAAAGALALGGAASAQAWMPMIERQAIVESGVAAGLASGELTGAEARAIRADMAALVGLEARYRLGGLSRWEKLDLDRRYGALDDRLRLAASDVDPVSLAAFENRRDRIERRVEQGVNSGQLTAAEADDLRADLRAVDRMEARFRADGVITVAEQNELNRRLELIATDVALARTDEDRVYGYNRR
jgi:hypothetical protein